MKRYKSVRIDCSETARFHLLCPIVSRRVSRVPISINVKNSPVWLINDFECRRIQVESTVWLNDIFPSLFSFLLILVIFPMPSTVWFRNDNVMILGQYREPTRVYSLYLVEYFPRERKSLNVLKLMWRNGAMVTLVSRNEPKSGSRLDSHWFVIFVAFVIKRIFIEVHIHHSFGGIAHPLWKCIIFCFIGFYALLCVRASDSSWPTVTVAINNFTQWNVNLYFKHSALVLVWEYDCNLSTNAGWLDAALSLSVCGLRLPLL